MNYERLFRKMLDTCIKYNSVDSYLFGRNGCFIKEDPRQENSSHAYNYAVYILNKVNKENPNLKLPDKYLSAIEKELNKEDLGRIDIYAIFKCILAQLTLENKKMASFTIQNDEKINLLNGLKQKFEEYQDALKNCDYAEGDMYADGLYGYINDKNDEYFKETGARIL